MSSRETAIEPVPRSPSPVVPGAWPTSASKFLHQRSNTFPGVSSLLSADSLHFDHIRRFQKRLSQTLSKTVKRVNVDTTVSRSTDHLGWSDNISIPSDGSGLTRSTQFDTNTSRSMSGDSSITTSYSTPVRGPIEFSRYANEEDRTQSASVVSKPRICDVSSDSISKIFPSTSSHDYATSPLASLTLSTQNSNHGHPPHIDLLASFNRSSSSSHPSPDPVSPIFFSSPTSSNNAVPCRHSYHGQGYCPSLEFSTSPSWETSFDTFNSLRIESGSYDIRPEQMLNPSRSQPFNTFDLYNNNDSSTELEVPTIPMLTTLSLPGSLDTTLDVSRRNSPRHHHAQDNSHTQDSPLLSSPLSVSEATGTNKNDSSTELEVPTSPMLTTLSLPGSLDTTLDVSRRNSPRHNHGQDNSHTQNSSISSSPLSVSEATGTVADITALEFPSPPLTLSPFITAPAPESPVIDLPIADSSTVEYASAVVSSSWGPDISIHPDYPLANIRPNVSSSSASETSGDPGLPQESTRGTKTSAMITSSKEASQITELRYLKTVSEMPIL
ncbi:hypothetical protein E4T56_gene9099 [Termitomyces sp. T112]|nr:hypothetical protein E4T56_gene9099 [Termitomyces sp. T112]